MGKVVSQQELILRCRQRKDSGHRIVFVAGVFDLLHPGHVRLLEQAGSYGDVLVAAVLNDSSVRAAAVAEPAQKNSRVAAVQQPITAAAERVEIVAALAAVDYAVEVSMDALPELLAELRPDTAVENAEPSGVALLAGAAKGGLNSVRIPIEPGHSTASIIERIVQLPGSE
ncbi:MAG TPA: adenylyltransferase/cytidyltransferase family protein [Candidatus Acidoferrales bacterium]|nr:adenylyltransferase/cytidyltransferase family protein [Candidatus Acidoferrales bacterium]